MMQYLRLQLVALSPELPWTPRQPEPSAPSSALAPPGPGQGCAAPALAQGAPGRAPDVPHRAGSREVITPDLQEHQLCSPYFTTKARF